MVIKGKSIVAIGLALAWSVPAISLSNDRPNIILL